MPEKPITKGLTPEVKQVLENLKTTNPNEYNKLGQSIFGQTDPMLRNKVIEQFKADPMAYINKYKAPVTTTAPTKPKNTFDEIYKSPQLTKSSLGGVNSFGQSLIPNLPKLSDGTDPYNDVNIKREETFKKNLEAKEKIQDFYEAKIRNPLNPALKESIYEIENQAKTNKDLKNSETYKMFNSDKISYIAQINQFKGTSDYDKIIQDPKTLAKVGLEYLSLEQGSPYFNKDMYNKFAPDLDRLMSTPYGKPLKLSNGETLSPKEVTIHKTKIIEGGKRFAIQEYQSSFETKVLPALEQNKLKFEYTQNQLEGVVKKLNSTKDKPTYNKILKEEYEPLKKEYDENLAYMTKIDEDLKNNEIKLNGIVNHKTKEEKRVQQLEDYSDAYQQAELLFALTPSLNKDSKTALANAFTDWEISKGMAIKNEDLSTWNKINSRSLNIINKNLEVTDLIKTDLSLLNKSIDPTRNPILWHTGEFDQDGNPVMSNRFMWRDSEGNRRYNLGAGAETGIFQTINMIGVGKLTGMFAKGIAWGGNLALKNTALAGAGRITSQNILNAGINLPWKSGSLGARLLPKINVGARALTYPAVYLTTYGRAYGEAIKQFRTMDEAKDYAQTSSKIEALTESVVPDVFFFSKTGLDKLGTVFNPKQLSFYKNFLSDAVKGKVKKDTWKALGMSVYQAGLNTVQEALIEEELNYLAMSEYETAKEEGGFLSDVFGVKQKDGYVRQEEKATFEGAVDLGIESLATMSISMLTGFPAQFKAHKQAYGYDFSKPESLAFHRYNVAVNGDLIKENIIQDPNLSKEDKMKQLETIEKYQGLLRDAASKIRKPDKKTLANDEENIYAYFYALSEKDKLEEKMLTSGLSANEQKKYEDLQLIQDKLDKENNDWARLEPEQRQKIWWKWFREGITESKETDHLKNSVYAGHFRAKSYKEAVTEQYENGFIDKKLYEEYMSNIKQAEETNLKNRKTKIQSNLDRLDELSERELALLEEDLIIDKALDNENTFIYNSKPTPLELKSQESLITYNEVLDNLPKDFAVELNYVTPSGKEYNVTAIEENGLLVNKDTFEVIPKEVTVKKAATIQPTINDVKVDTEQEFVQKLQTVKNKFNTTKSERLNKSFEGFEEDLKTKIQEKHKELKTKKLTVEQLWEEANNFVESLNLPKETTKQTKDDIKDLVVNLNSVKVNLQPKEQTPVVTETTTSKIDILNNVADIEEEIARLQEQLTNAPDISSKIILQKQIKALQVKLNTPETEQTSSTENVDDSVVISPENEKEIKELKLQIFLLENENKVVTLNNLTGTLRIINEDRVEIEKDDVIYEIQTSEIVSYKEEIKSDKYNISNLTESNVTVNGIDYTINLDNKGNIESISPTNKPEQKIKNNALVIKIEIERNKLETNTKVENVSEKLIKNNYKNLDDLLNNIYNVNFTDTVNTALDKLYNNEKLTDSEKLQLGLWLEDAFSRISNLFDAKNTEEEKETLLNAYDNLEIMFSLLHGIPFKTSTKKEKNERKNNVGKTEIEQSSEESKRENIKQSEKSEKLIELQNKLEDLQTPKEEEVVIETPPVVTKVETTPITEEVVTTEKAPVVETPQTKPIITYSPSQKVTEAYIRKNAKKVGDRIQVTFPLNDKHGVVPEGIFNPLTISTKRSLEDLITMLLYDQSNMKFNESNPLAKYRGLLYLLEELNKVDSYDKLSTFAKGTFNETKKEIEKAFERFKSIIIETPNDQTTIQNIPETTDTKTNELVKPQPDIEAEKTQITTTEFTELVRLGKFFLENPKEPSTVGSVVNKYPALFKEVSDIERRRQEELDTTKEEKYIKQYLPDLFKNISNREQLEDVITFVKENITKDKKLTNTKELEKAAIDWLNKTKYPDKINAKYDAELKALEQTESNKEIKKDTSIQDNKIVSLYKELMSTGKLKFTDEEGKPC